MTAPLSPRRHAAVGNTLIRTAATASSKTCPSCSHRGKQSTRLCVLCFRMTATILVRSFRFRRKRETASRRRLRTVGSSRATCSSPLTDRTLKYAGACFRMCFQTTPATSPGGARLKRRKLDPTSNPFSTIHSRFPKPVPADTSWFTSFRERTRTSDPGIAG